MHRAPIYSALALALLSGALLSTLGCAALAIEPASPESTFESDWGAVPDRVWIGERHWANRLQDWRIEGGVLECLEARPRFGMRTLHLLTHRLSGETSEGSFRMTVRIDAPEGDRKGSAAGFLVGAGGQGIDYRLTTQVHGTSAEDGGFLGLLGADGRVRFADFETPINDGSKNQWAMSSSRELTDFASPEGVTLAGAGFGEAGPSAVDLEIVGAKFDGRRTLTLTARRAPSVAGDGSRAPAGDLDENSGESPGESSVGDAPEVLSTAYWESAAETAFDGAVALVSHRGPMDAGAGYRFQDWLMAGELVAFDGTREFGPILFVHYVMDSQADGTATLGLTAQAGPLGPDDGRVATLVVKDVGSKSTLTAEAQFVPDSATFHFSLEGLDPTVAKTFTVRYMPKDASGEPAPRRAREYPGEIPAAPVDGMTVAVLNCQKSYTGALRWNESGLWFPHRDIRDHAAAHEPDLLYFAGDQIYEGDLTPAIRSPFAAAMNDYLTKWYRHGWSFGELTRRLPSVVVPDDHDVYHGNIWGNAGVRMEAPEGVSKQDRGGYVMSPQFVNGVHRTQVSHLPQTLDEKGTLSNGIVTYHTDLNWGGGSFAILDDRMYKSPPAVVVPEGQVRNGWFLAEGYDPATQADVEGAVLLGDSQEAMLRAWASDWGRGAWFKAVLSQTPFANVATIPVGANSGNIIPSLKVAEIGGYIDGDKMAADTDSNGWPQTPRDRAVRLLRAAGAVHLTGDQHLGSTLRYGVDEFDDAGFVLSSPAVANTWPRRWFPNPTERQPGPPVAANAPDYTGRFFDGFGNRMTVHAVANPRQNGVEPTRLNERAPGYGIMRVVRDDSVLGGGHVTLEAWPRHVAPGETGAAPYDGWPVAFSLADGDGREPVGFLPALDLSLIEGEAASVAVFKAGQGSTSSLLYSRPLTGSTVQLPIFDANASYQIVVWHYGKGESPEAGLHAAWQDVRPVPAGANSTLLVPVLDGPGAEATGDRR